MWRDTVSSASTPKSLRWGPKVPESWTQDHGKEVQRAPALFMSVCGEKCSWYGREKTAASWFLCDSLDPAPKQEATLVGAYIQMEENVKEASAPPLLQLASWSLQGSMPYLF